MAHPVALNNSCLLLVRLQLTILHFRHYEIDTGKCGPRLSDNWWFHDPNEAENEMINYMQIKQWGPEAGRLSHTITNNVLW